MGLLLAAGRARRMGVLKQTLPWAIPGSTVISSAFDAIAPFCSGMVVVASTDNAAAIKSALGDRHFFAVEGDGDAPMIESVRVGFHAILAADCDSCGVLMQPGDHPGVAPATVERVLDVSREHPERAAMPEHLGKGGHPVFIPRNVMGLICKGPSDLEGGLRQFWIEHPELRQRIVVNDPLCVLDVDTPEQYQRALQAAVHASR